MNELGEPVTDRFEDRLRCLEDRVAALERVDQAPSRPATETLAPSPADGTSPSEGRLWALENLRSRVGDPGAVLFAGSVRLPAGGRAEWQQGHPTGALLDLDWGELADALAALGHPVRLVILREVLRGSRTAAELGAVEGLGTSGQVYHHIRQLVAAGWLRATGRGQFEVPAARVVPLLVTVTAAQR